LYIAITREVSSSIGRCELKHIPRKEINIDVARAQHYHYERYLEDLGCEVITLQADSDLPDSVFVEDTAIVLDEIAIITRTGAISRRPETTSIARTLVSYRPISYIKSPGIVDGGDVLQIDKTLFVGLSSCTNQSSIEQIRLIVEPYGYKVESIKVSGCLHLKSAITEVAEKTVLINRSWVEITKMDQMNFIEVDPSEPYGANALLVGESTIYPSEFPRTRKRLEDYGISVRIIDVSELRKAEGGVSCCCLLLKT